MLSPEITARSICQPIDSYPVIYQDDTVKRALVKLQFSLCNSSHKRRHLLVLDRNDRHTGWLTIWDILAILQPGWSNQYPVTNIDYVKGWNLSTYTNSSTYFIRQLVWWVSDDTWPSLEKHCEKIANIQVNKLARPLESCSVESSTCLKEVAAIMVEKNLFSLPVVDKGELVGFIRSEDIILEVARIMMNIEVDKVKKDKKMAIPVAHSP